MDEYALSGVLKNSDDDDDDDDNERGNRIRNIV
jgi:hypothetical protein